MRALLKTMAAFLLDATAPPRPSERVVRRLTLQELQGILEGGALPYHDPRVTALVWEVKYRANSRALALAGAILAEALIDAAQDGIGVPLLVPVPMHRQRRKERGHNQTELLCQAALARLHKDGQHGFVAYAPRALMRERHTPSQQGLSKTARLHNIEGSMRVTQPERIQGRRCIVLDDVSTTGATFAEAKRALKAAGASRVEHIALAHS